jgi:tripartite-type tricarboxylate transporter receptor subunit TctC
LPGAVYAFWNGMFVPAKTPRPIVDRLYQEMQKTIADASVKERLAKMGFETLVMSQPEFERYFKADVLDTEKLAKAAGIEKQ